MSSSYDYIITGAGLAGLLCAYRMSKHPFYNDKKILLIDKVESRTNNRTWSFWQKGSSFIDELVSNTWSEIYVAGPLEKLHIGTADYHYSSIKSIDFYRFMDDALAKSKNIERLHAELESITESGEQAVVHTDKGDFAAALVLNSALRDSTYLKQEKYPVLKQHFMGWFIKMEQPIFNKNLATFMDFNVDRQDATCFMYILPSSETEALLEYTLFSAELLSKEEYEAGIKNYIKNNFGDIKFEIVEKEAGIIPMTSYPFWKHNSAHVFHIGTAGGWTKASTGYTFSAAVKKSSLLIDAIAKGTSLARLTKRNRFWYYDLIFLDVLASHNDRGAELFNRMFRYSDLASNFRFLDEESSIQDEATIISSMPKGIFMKAAFRRLFGLSKKRKS